ncbi:MAG: hypothetical protein AAF735_04590 [Myxococcota bacterium]
MAAFASLPSLTFSGESSSFGANLGAFTKGFADGFVSGLAVKVGLRLVAATFGAPVATGIGIAALAYGLYNTDFGALRTSITNIGSGNGTPADFEAAGELASMLVGVGKGRGGGKNPAPTSPKVGNRGTKSGAKRGPKTDPNAPHNAKIRSEGDRLASEGNRIVAGGGRVPERLVPTPGGFKSGRRPDIIYESPGGSRRGVNVGRRKADGSPVSREQRALDDLNGPGQLPTDFVPYD